MESLKYVVQLIVPFLDRIISEYRYFAIILLCGAKNNFELF